MIYPAKLRDIAELNTGLKQAVGLAADELFSPVAQFPGLALISGVGALGGLGLGVAANQINAQLTGDPDAVLVNDGLVAAVGAGLLPTVALLSGNAAKHRYIGEKVSRLGDWIVNDAEEQANARRFINHALANRKTAFESIVGGETGVDPISPWLALATANRMFDYGG